MCSNGTKAHNLLDSECAYNKQGKEYVNPVDMVAHVCNPTYSGGGDQEHQGWRPAEAKSLRDPPSQPR
jgi:hypothetical protein